MATKKQKHAEALSRREKFLAEERARGLRAQLAGHKRRERNERKKLQQENRRMDAGPLLDVEKDRSSMEMECI